MAATSPREFSVSIRSLQGGNTHVVNVRSDMNVGEVKRLFAERAGIDPNQFKLVFAGHKLEEANTLEMLGLMGYSTLHCVRGRGGVQVDVTPNPSITATSMRSVENKLADVNLDQQNGRGEGGEPHPVPSTPPKSSSKKNRFFIYCKDVCEKMQPGKLRVRCSSCGDESFVLSKGPDNWDDVLKKNKIEGTCNRENCQGTKFAEFFFKCGGHDANPGQINHYMALHMVRANTVEVMCASCADVSDTVVRFDCNHCMCVDCFVQYCTVNVMSRSFRKVDEIGYTIECPDKCDNSYVKEIHHFQLMGKELYERYKNFAAEEFVLQMGGVLCPARGCGAGILLEDGNRRVQCPTCQHLFCKNCKANFHQGSSCTEAPPNREGGAEGQQFDQQRLQQARWDDESERFIRESTGIRTCPGPGCGAQIEKSVGCNHMTCSRCRHEFCWLCLSRWGSNCQDTHWFAETL